MLIIFIYSDLFRCNTRQFFREKNGSLVCLTHGHLVCFKHGHLVCNLHEHYPHFSKICFNKEYNYYYYKSYVKLNYITYF